MLRKWLAKGESRPKTPYRKLWNLFRKWAAEATAAAESQQLAKAPTQWLERNSTARLIQADEAKDLATHQSKMTVIPNDMLRIGAQQVLNALTVLSDANISIDDGLRKRQISIPDPIIIEEPEDAEE